ncbi:MAG: hypothetical protein OEY38_02210 [Gammaproteobacteria bacterium]|nr:hypothetical protein [Gammaproteobacteria bacterium]
MVVILIYFIGAIVFAAILWAVYQKYFGGTMNNKVEFEIRAVAFIDVLGFKSVVAEAESEQKVFSELESLITILSTAVPNLDGSVDQNVPSELIPKHIYISDCIILSAPLTSDKRKSYNGLSILVMRVIQLTHILLDKGYLIRGGISIGNVWHTESNIVGVAYQEAYMIEQKVVVPCVELSSTAIDHWNKSEYSSNSMCLEYCDKVIVNGLHDFYIQDESSQGTTATYEGYLQTVENNVERALSEDVRYKWWWFGQFIKREIERNPYNVD